MSERGKVIEVNGDEVLLELVRSSACESCKACSKGHDSTTMNLKAFNKCGANVGDYVDVELPESIFLKAIFIMYGFPLLALVGGVGVATYLGFDEKTSFFVGILVTLLCFGIIKLKEKTIKQSSYLPIAKRKY